MLVVGEKKTLKIHYEYDDALDLCGVGKYNIFVLWTCGLLCLSVVVEIFGFSVILPAIACDLSLTTSQQGLLSAVPLIGLIFSYVWGICSDTRGRRFTILVAMPVGSILSIIAGLAPNYWSLVTLKFFSSCFISAVNATGFVMMGETIPRRQRNYYMSIHSSITMISQLLASAIALPFNGMSFDMVIPLLEIQYRPWRLVMLLFSLPAIIGTLCSLLLYESPKFLLHKGKNEAAVNVLRCMYRWNTGLAKETYPVWSLAMEESSQAIDSAVKTSALRSMWNQTAPLFKPPLLKNSIIIYYLLLSAFMTSTGYGMWVPTMVNHYFNGEDHNGKNLCEVISRTAVDIPTKTNLNTDCDHTIETTTLYAVMVFSGACGVFNVLLSFIVGPLGKKKSTLLVLIVSITSGITILFAKIPYLSMSCFFMFLYVATILGTVNTYLVELNPTHLRGMALSLATVVSRSFGFVSVQLIASMLGHHCSTMITGYILLVATGFITAMFLPPDTTVKNSETPEKSLK